MAAQTRAKGKKGAPAKQSPLDTAAVAASQRRTKYIAVIGLVVIVAAIAGALIYGLRPSSPAGSISRFQHTFVSAATVGVYVADFNVTGYPLADGCANNLIEMMVASTQNHRAPASINFFVVNQSSCSYSRGLGSTINTTVISAAQCMNLTATEPSIFVNYSATNSTVVKDNVLYVSGTGKFLSECGVASELYPA